MLSTNDRCQVLSCTNGRFTFCPHCSSHVCLQCLNDHYKLIENEYKRDIINICREFDWERCNKIEHQKNRLNRLYENELKRQCQFKNFLQNKIDQNGQPSMNCFRPCEDQKLKETFSHFNHQSIKFDQLVHQINKLLYHFEQDIDISNIHVNQLESINSYDSSVSSNLDSHDHDNPTIVIELDTDSECYSSAAIEELDTGNKQQTKLSLPYKIFLEEAGVKSDDETVKANITQYDWNDQNQHRSNGPDTKRTYTYKELVRLRLRCPLTKFKLGLNESHCQLNGIARIPCNQSIHRTYVLYSHLRKYHLFNYHFAIQIVRAVASSSEQLDQLDLFSDVPLNELTQKSIWYIRSYCPLIKMGNFGLLPIHQVKLCDENQISKTYLHHHLTDVHKISRLYASKLVHAIMEKKDENTVIFPPTDSIIQ